LYVLCAFLCFCVHDVFWCVLCVWAKLPEIKLDDRQTWQHTPTHFLALRPWPLTFWTQKITHNTMLQDHQVYQIWCSVWFNRFWVTLRAERRIRHQTQIIAVPVLHSDSWLTSCAACSGAATLCPCPWPWPFDLESSIRVTCDVGYLCDNFGLPGPLCSRLRPDVRDRRQTDRHQTSDAHHRLMPLTRTGGA